MLDSAAHERMIASFDMNTAKPEWALGHASDIALHGATAGRGPWRVDCRKRCTLCDA